MLKPRGQQAEPKPPEQNPVPDAEASLAMLKQGDYFIAKAESSSLPFPTGDPVEEIQKSLEQSLPLLFRQWYSDIAPSSLKRVFWPHLTREPGDNS